MDDIRYLKEKYGPFEARCFEARVSFRCSFCTKKHKQFLKVVTDKKPNICLYACLPCSIELLGKSHANKVWFSSFKEVLVDVSFGD